MDLTTQKLFFLQMAKEMTCTTLGTAQPPTVTQCLTCCVTITGFSPPSTEIPTIAQSSERNRALHVVYINECSDKPQTPRRCPLPGEQALERAGWASEPWPALRQLPVSAFPPRRSIRGFCSISAGERNAKDGFLLKRTCGWWKHGFFVEPS